MNNRIINHPVLGSPQGTEITFSFNGTPMKAFYGEMISTALFANGIRTFGRHHKDNSPQGIFCANGQCAQCLVIANGNAVKSCVTEIRPGMKILPAEGLPELPADDTPPGEKYLPPREFETDILIMGAGPAGLSAAIELAGKGLKIILADDKNAPGGKLSLQTHNFFGTAKECNAGKRGMDIGTILTNKARSFENIQIWTSSPVVGAFSDGKIGIVKEGRFVLVKPGIFLVSAGAREKTIAFPGSDLPGVYGAGALQTIVNRDLVKAAEKLFIVGGGNVGLITAYHALQAGIKVLGIVEALPQCGGYKVHLDKIRRLGIPVWTSQTVLRAEGSDKLESVIIAQVDKNFKPVPGTERRFEIDTLLIAVGLSSVNEMKQQAESFGIKTYAAGDADIIAEASAAIFSGKITGRKILNDLGFKTSIPAAWENMAEILRSKPGRTKELDVSEFKSPGGVYPVIRCVQEIPCNPCAESCMIQSLKIDSESMMQTPGFKGLCGGCARCVSTCPGLAITLVDENYDAEKQKAVVIIPWELPENTVKIGETKITVGFEGEDIGEGRILALRNSKWQDRRKLLYLEVPFNDAKLVAGIRLYDTAETLPVFAKPEESDGSDIIICKCERVTKKQIADKIKSGCRDFNALKAELRIGMGPCGGKTCLNLIWGIFRELGIKQEEVTSHAYRPYELEVEMEAFLKN